MSKKVFVFMAPGFEEMELTITTDILRRANLHVKTVTISSDLKPVTGSRKMQMIPDTNIDDPEIHDADLIVLPGGIEGTRNLADSNKVVEIIKQMHEKNRPVAAICAAPAVLVKAGIAKGKKLTSHPAAMDVMQGVNYCENRVVKDGNIITSRAAGTSFEFAFALIEELLDKETAEQVNKGVLALY